MQHIHAEIITIGDEILYGQITDTNSQMIATELDKIGIRVVRRTAVGDTQTAIINALEVALQIADIVIFTGGLGPTKDDITKTTLCEFFDAKLIQQPEILAHIENLFAQKGRVLNDLNRQQARFPDKAEMIWNPIGTAPGMWFTQEDKVIISMPGVPREMQCMMTETIAPKLQETFHTPFIYHKIIRTINLPESILAEKIATWEDNLPNHIKLAYLPRMGQVRMRLTATGENMAQIQAETHTEIDKVLPLIKPHVFGFDNEEIEEVTGRELAERGLTIASAESCTGGLVAHHLTKIAGASRYFVGGIVAYDNRIKIRKLDIPEKLIRKYGAVSQEIVSLMAENIRKKYGTYLGVATSGIAGPDGGTPDKPVGTIWIAVSCESKTFSQKLQLTTDRTLNMQLTVNYLLNKVRQMAIEMKL